MRRAMFKVAVIGASGLLGRAVVRELEAGTDWQIVQTAFRHAGPRQVTLDVRDAQAVEAFVAREAPDATSVNRTVRVAARAVAPVALGAVCAFATGASCTP